MTTFEIMSVTTIVVVVTAIVIAAWQFGTIQDRLDRIQFTLTAVIAMLTGNEIIGGKNGRKEGHETGRGERGKGGEE